MIKGARLKSNELKMVGDEIKAAQNTLLNQIPIYG